MNAFDDNDLPSAKPVLGWPGGKTRLLKHLLPLLPEHSLYCEVFGGGLAMFLGKEPSDVEVINDFNGDLVSFYRTCKYHLDPLLDELDLVLHSRQELQDYIKQPGLTEIQRAARFFLRNKLSFGGMGTSFAVQRQHAPASRANRLGAIRSLNRRLDKTIIEHLTWERCLDLYDSDSSCFFLDPPYLDSGGGAYDGWSEHELTRFCLRIPNLKGKWLFTFQDCEQVRTLMSGFSLKPIERANGIGNNSGKTGRTYREVAIWSERMDADFAKGVSGA